MDFLTKLYSNDNFGIILFTSISILVLAFLIILFFGKKDQKERKLAETKVLSTNKNDEKEKVAFEEKSESKQLEIQPTIENTVEPIVPFTATPNVEVVNEPIAPPIVEKPIENEVSEPLPPKTDFDFDALAASISKELESIGVDTDELENTRPLKPVIEPSESTSPISITDFDDYQEEPMMEPIIAPMIEPEIQTMTNPNPIVFNTPVQKEPVTEIKAEENPQPVIEEKPKISRPAPFSSVFVSKKEDTPEMPPINNEVVEETQPVMEKVPPKPVMELPKTIDLPKLNTSTETTKQEAIPNITFGSLEQDIPNYGNNNENRM